MSLFSSCTIWIYHSLHIFNSIFQADILLTDICFLFSPVGSSLLPFLCSGLICPWNSCPALLGWGPYFLGSQFSLSRFISVFCHSVSSRNFLGKHVCKVKYLSLCLSENVLILPFCWEGSSSISWWQAW